MVLLLLFGPALLALGALFGIVLMVGRLGESTPRQRAGLWVLIVALGVVALHRRLLRLGVHRQSADRRLSSA